MTILQVGAPLLRQIAKDVESFGSQELKDLVVSLFEVMAQRNGAGLAAPQIGISRKVFVYGFDFNPRYPDAPPVPKTCVINPSIIWESQDKTDFEEGCLSVPNLRGIVSRPESIACRYYDEMGNEFERTLSGFEARVFQHENDHIMGRLFIDLAHTFREITPGS